MGYNSPKNEGVLFFNFYGLVIIILRHKPKFVFSFLYAFCRKLSIDITDSNFAIFWLQTSVNYQEITFVDACFFLTIVLLLAHKK